MHWCTCVHALVCVHEYLIVSVSLLTGDLFSGLVSLPRFFENVCVCVCTRVYVCVHASVCMKIVSILC